MYYSMDCKHLVLLALGSLLTCSQARFEPLSGAPSTLNTDCSCGFYDSSTGNLFTDSLIVYFNETTSLPTQDFSTASYTHKYEKGFNIIYRQGAKVTNVQLGQTSDSEVFSGTSLQLYVDPASNQHVVVGGEIMSVRQDMQYGSFSALVKGPPRSNSGSAMSMAFRFNETQEWDMDLLNTDNPETAWLATLFGGEFPVRSLGVNYSTLGNTSLSNYTSPPWDFLELKVDWDEKSINYSVGGILARSVTRDQSPTIPSVPGPLIFKHWSNGNKFESQGPPYARALAQVGWTRSFFNSSTTTKNSREQFDATCDRSAACLVSDMSLRGSTSYVSEATVPWKQKASNFKMKIFAIAIVTLGTVIGVLVVSNATMRRVVARRDTSRRNKEETTSSNASTFDVGSSSSSLCDADARPAPPSTRSSATFSTGGNTEVGTECNTAATSKAPSVTESVTPAAGIADSSMQHYSSPLKHNQHQDFRYTTFQTDTSVTDVIEKEKTIANDEKGHDEDGKTTKVSATKSPPALDTAGKLLLHGGKPRIDYLAGIVALCTLGVTLIHFCQTFLPALQSGYNNHYKSEIWARRIITSYFLNVAVIGLFFTTSTRFLTAGYLMSGNLGVIGQKTVTRAFRLIIPVAGVVILEYFLIDCGATDWLEYLASITWSTWPYTVRYNNFGEFLNELLELLYLIPNAAPQITFNYCTGVLWTIPVSIQGSWISLLGVMIIYQIKNPWKRGGYYAVCILLNWYARAWGAYFWAGLLLTDLNVTYSYHKWIAARPVFRFILVIICVLVAFAMLSWDMLLIDADVPLLELERGIHPDLATGRPIAQTIRNGYPEYFEPRLNGLIFAVAVQVAVEISPRLQAVLSSRILMWVFPHISTIYLFHGFVFWSLGATIVVHLSTIGIPYWAIMLVTAVSCWGTLFLSMSVLTPAVELLGTHVTAAIWRHAQEASAKKEGTLWPFERALLLGREGKAGDEEGVVTYDVQGESVVKEGPVKGKSKTAVENLSVEEMN